MAISKCVKCDGTRFELSETLPAGATHRLYFVQCSKCGGVVGTVPFADLATILVRQDAAIKEIAKKVGATVKL